MSDKIARLGIERDNDKMYYIKNGDVWATPRKQPKGRSEKVAETGLDLDYSRYIYYLDSDGDVARKERALGGGGGGGRKAKTTKAVASSKPSRSAPPARKEHEMVWTGRRGKKSDAQLDREIEECLAQAKSRRAANNGGNGNGSRAAGNGNGNGSRSAATAPKRGGRKTKRR